MRAKQTMQFAITEHFVDIALPLSSTFVSYILYKYSLVGYKNQADRSKKVENLRFFYIIRHFVDFSTSKNTIQRAQKNNFELKMR